MSDLSEELKALLSSFTLICNLSKEAADVIQECLNEKSSCENTKKEKKVIEEKISKTCDSLQHEIKKIDNTKSKLLNLSNKDDKDSTEVSQPTTASESIETENKKTEGLENDKKEENKENESEEKRKPMLKIVDFSKLVDPRNLELMNKNHKRKERNMNSSIIVLSSSEDEKTDKNMPKNPTPKINSKTKVDTVKIRSFPVSSIKNFLQNTSANSKVKSSVIVSKKPAQIKKVARVTKVDRIDELCGKDVKFRSKCYVRLLRVPCESLKSYYCGSIVSEEEDNVPITLDERTGEIIDNSVSEADQPCRSAISKDKNLSESIKTKSNSDNLDNLPPSKKKLRSADKEQKNENIKTDHKSKMSDMSAKNSKSKSEENKDKFSKQRCRQRKEGNDSDSESDDDSKGNARRILRNKKNKSKKVRNSESENTNSCDDTVGNRKKTTDVSSEQTNPDKNSNQSNEQTVRNENDSTKNKSRELQKSNKNDRKAVQPKDDETDIGNDEEQRKKGAKKHPVDSKKTCVDIKKIDSKKVSSSKVSKSSDEEIISQKETDNTGEKNSHKKKDIENTTDEAVPSKIITSEERDQDEPAEKASDQLEGEQEKSKNREKTNGEKEKVDSNKETILDGDDHQETETEITTITSDKETIESTEKNEDTIKSKTTEKHDKQKKNREKVLEYDISSGGEEENEVSITKKQLEKHPLQLEANISDDENGMDQGNESNSNEVEDNENKSDGPKTSLKKKNLDKKSDKHSSDDEIKNGKDENNEGKSRKKKKKDADESNEERSSSESDNEGKRKRMKSKSPDKEDEISCHSSDSDESNFEIFNRRKMKNNKRVAKETKRRIRDSEDSDSDKKEKSDSELNDSNQKANSDSSDADSGDDQPKKTNNRKRIRKTSDNSSASDDEVTTRKKIKKLISKDSLSDQTKKAAAEERERKQRIAEKQKKYNQIYEISDIASSKVDKLVLDFDEETREPLLEVDKSIVAKLKPHQASGIQFMWDTCFESLERTQSSSGSGCILAHCMGLGKTLQVITLINTLLEASEKTKIKTVLIVTPLSTVLNWKAEFEYWLPENEEYEVYELASSKCQNSERAYCVNQWHKNGGVLITSYALFRNLSNDKNRRVTKKIRQMFIEGFVDPGPDLVICDEGHLLKNEKTSLSVAMNKIKTRRRIVLTGTPLQNNLKEYYCMVQFVKPNLLGTYREYLNRFVNPITNGQYTDSTQYDINIMRRRSHVLHKLLDGIVQRRDYAVLSPYLPPKFEYVMFLNLTECQKKLYTHYMDHFAQKTQDEGSNKTSYLFKDYQALSRICIHPRVLLDKSIDDQQKLPDSDEESIGSLKDFIADESSDSDSSSSKSKSDSDSSSESVKKKKKKKRSKRVTRAQSARQKDSNNESEEEEEEEEEKDKEWWQQYCDGDELDNIAHSTKLLLLFEILKECEQIGDKVLVFSQSLYALNVIEYFLEKIDEATQNGTTAEKTLGYSGSWSPGLDYFRLDGSTNCSLRSNWCDSFNKESNTRARLFLLSTRAGGLGINLVGANRVIIFDVSWNPSYDTQSIYRVYRFGQLKPAYIYRFVIYGTMEMKIYERQVTKQAISKRVIDEQQIDRHYKQNDLTELYKFEVPDPKDRPTPLVPKDVLLGEMIRHHEDKIFKYHEHQSLLENKEDETLNEEERKAAWDEFENEKVERTKQTLIGNFSMNTVQVALKSIIKRDNPSWNNNQILSIIPQLIQQLNIQINQGDNTMYNRIATEVKMMQDEYARKMQMQMNQYRLQMAQRQQQMSAAYGMPNPFSVPNPYFNQFQNFMNNTLPAPGPSTFNPNDVVELN